MLNQLLVQLARSLINITILLLSSFIYNTKLYYSEYFSLYQLKKPYGLKLSLRIKF